MTMDFEYTISAEEINISNIELGRVIGYKDKDIPEMVLHEIEYVLTNLASRYAIRGGFKHFDNFLPGKESIVIEGLELKCMDIIAAAFRKADSAAIMVCTAGHDISKWIGELFVRDDALKAYIADIAASLAVEKAANIIQEKVEKHAASLGLKISNRYSPGYCGWDVSEQKKLFSLLPANFCGISLNEVSLMNPVKSISGIIGLGQDVRMIGYLCNKCSRKDCLMAKAN